MLNAIEERSRQLGWLVISETASPGFVDRITRQHLPLLLRRFDPAAVRQQLTGVTAPFNIGSLSWEAVEAHAIEAGLRNQIALLTDLLVEHETGLLITLDEIHAHEISGLRELATTVQHAFREERQLALVGAGLSSTISDVLNDSVLTFLRRAERHHLGSVGIDDVRRAIREPVEENGRFLSEQALAVMAEGTRGYPFLIQLVGAQTWRSRPHETEISLDDAEQGVMRARRRLGSLVHAPALAGTSDVDKSFLLAMAKDDGPSKIADIRSRLHVEDNYAQVYRLRLKAAELIYTPRHGYVDFTLPYLREYLREHAAADFHTTDR